MILFRPVYPKKCIQTKAALVSTVNTDKSLASTVKELTVKVDSDSTCPPLSEANSDTPCDPILSAKLDQALANVEYFRKKVEEGNLRLIQDRDALLHWLRELQTLQDQIPYQNPFKDFVETL